MSLVVDAVVMPRCSAIAPGVTTRPWFCMAMRNRSARMSVSPSFM
jgi:hypothetical protein